MHHVYASGSGTAFLGIDPRKRRKLLLDAVRLSIPISARSEIPFQPLDGSQTAIPSRERASSTRRALRALRTNIDTLPEMADSVWAPTSGSVVPATLPSRHSA